MLSLISRLFGKKRNSTGKDAPSPYASKESPSPRSNDDSRNSADYPYPNSLGYARTLEEKKALQAFLRSQVTVTSPASYVLEALDALHVLSLTWGI